VVLAEIGHDGGADVDVFARLHLLRGPLALPRNKCNFEVVFALNYFRVEPLQPGGAGGGAPGGGGSGWNCTRPGGMLVPGGGAVPGSGSPSCS
jgi:hypothetical protein